MKDKLSSATWPNVSIAEIAAPIGKAIVSGPFGSNIGSRFFVDDGVPVIRGNNLTLGRKKFVDDGFVFITEEKAHELRNCEALPGDIVFTAAGTLGQVGLIPRHPRFPRYIISNKQLRVRFDRARAAPDYLYYWFSAPAMREHIANQNRGSSVPLITLGTLRGLEVTLPPLPIQRRIASILSAYDDLVENNTRRVAILEEMARRIYEEWFVRFRFPGHEDARMVESGLGLVPEAWPVVRLDDVLVLQRGFDLPKQDRTEGPFPIISATGASATHHECKVKGPGVVTGRSGSLGTVMYVEGDFWPLNTTLWVKQFSVGSPLYALYVLRSIDLIGFNSGAAVPTLNRNDVHGLPVVRPTPDVLLEFDKVVGPMIRLKGRLELANENLRTTRDFMLPKLISGELDVSAMPEPDVLAA